MWLGVWFIVAECRGLECGELWRLLLLLCWCVVVKACDDNAGVVTEVLKLVPEEVLEWVL